MSRTDISCYRNQLTRRYSAILRFNKILTFTILITTYEYSYRPTPKDLGKYWSNGASRPRSFRDAASWRPCKYRSERMCSQRMPGSLPVASALIRIGLASLKTVLVLVLRRAEKFTCVIDVRQGIA